MLTDSSINDIFIYTTSYNYFYAMIYYYYGLESVLLLLYSCFKTDESVIDTEVFQLISLYGRMKLFHIWF